MAWMTDLAIVLIGLGCVANAIATIKLAGIVRHSSYRPSEINDLIRRSVR